VLQRSIDVTALQKRLDHFAQLYCPVVSQLKLVYSWSLMQVEYATDLVFKAQQALQAFYPHLLETLIQAVKPADIATFLGRKLHGNYQDELGNSFQARIEGTHIRHRMGPVTLKMYDKFGIVLRIETTVADVSFFQQRRQVHHRDGTTSIQWTKMRKSIYSLPLCKNNSPPPTTAISSSSRPSIRLPAVVSNCANSHQPKPTSNTGTRAFISSLKRMAQRLSSSKARWKDVLSAEELVLYEEKAAQVLTPDCRAWLERGRVAL